MLGNETRAVTQSQTDQTIVSGEVRGAPPLRFWFPFILFLAYTLAVGVTRIQGGFLFFMAALWGGVWITLLTLVYWLFFSKAQSWERFVGLAAFLLGLGALMGLGDPSLKGFISLVYQPLAMAACAMLFGCLLLGRQRPIVRTLCISLAVLLTFGFHMLLRLEGISGEMYAKTSFRWNPTDEQKFIAEKQQSGLNSQPAGPSDAAPGTIAPLTADASDWTVFRGGRFSSVQMENFPTQCSQGFPLKWRVRVGPGWGSMCVVGNHIFTQEQRQQMEAVACYDFTTGKELWAHEATARFEEVVAGPGPRATPTFDSGKIYALGASGALCCLDAATGKLIWQRDALADVGGKKLPMWGFASSPAVMHGLVISLLSASDGKGAAVAHDAQSGEIRWVSGAGTHSYSSPQPLNILGKEQICMATNWGVQSLEPDTGGVIWEHSWDTGEMARVVQPRPIGERQILVGTGYGLGCRLLELALDGEKWTVKEKWTSKSLKPYFNDFVVRGDYAYGFDDAVFGCIRLSDGKRMWKKGRYGAGQVLLVEPQGVLLVLGEQGQVVLLQADPNEFKELCKFQALEGKTWNHPVIVRGRLLLRNAAEMACYDVPTLRSE